MRVLGTYNGALYLRGVDSIAPSRPAPAMDRPITRQRIGKRLRWALIALLVAALAGLVAWLVPARGALVVDAAAIETGAIVRAPFQDYLPLRAEVAPLHSVVVAAVSGGSVAALDVQDGVLVRAGAPLARLDNPALRLEVAGREVEIASRLADVSAQELALRRNRADLDTGAATAANEVLRAEHELQQHQTLFDKGILALAAIEPYRREAAFRRSRLAALRAGEGGERTAEGGQMARLAQTRALLSANLAAVRGELGGLVLRAPVAGRLTGFTLQPGQPVKAGDPLGQIDSEGAYKLIGEVDEFYLARLSPGQRATADIDGTAARLTVTRVLPQVVNGRFKVEVAFAGAAPAGLRRGQAVDARVTLGGSRSAVVAPAGAWLDAGGTTAFVMAGERHAVRRAITVGRRTPEQVEVTGGLAPGERIVTSGIAAYRAQTSLIIRKGDQE